MKLSCSLETDIITETNVVCNLVGKKSEYIFLCKKNGPCHNVLKKRLYEVFEVAERKYCVIPKMLGSRTTIKKKSNIYMVYKSAKITFDRNHLI